MYCPICFNNSLAPKSRGVVKINFNNKHRETSLFTYNTQKESIDELDEKLKERIMDFFKWYATFKNRDTIKTFEIYSGDFVCEKNQCKISATSSFSVVDIIYPQDKVIELINEAAQKYQIKVDLDQNN